MFAALFLSGVADAQDLPALFNPSPVSGVDQVTALPSVDRITVSPDFSLINPEKNPVPAMTAAMPDRTIVLLLNNIETRGVNDYSWFGKVEGHELSTVVLSVVGGIMYGRMDMEGESYAISPDNGAYLIIKNDPTAVMPFDEDALVPPLTAAAAGRATHADILLADDGSVIDVLVLYTQEMQTHYGAGLTAKIQLFIDLSNAAYTNSGVSTSLRLAHSALYTDGNAAEGVLINPALNYLTTDATIGTLRNAYSADLVSLLRVYHDTTSCGLAWIMQTVSNAFANYAFSVVEVRSASEAGPPTYYYCDDTTFAHELGHNMGCAHDRAHSGGSGAFPYSYGYDYQAAGIINPQFGTIMSYVPPTITFFSTPSTSYLGVPIGITGGPTGSDNPTTSADNARSINNTRVTVANFRVGDTTPPAAPVSLSATPATWTNVNSFTINWTNPSDPSGIAGAYYKVGASPISDTDGTYTTSKPFIVPATAQGGQTIYVWLKDGSGNTSHSNSATTMLYYDGTVPADGTITASQAGTQALLNWSGFTDSGGSGLRSANTYKVVRNAGTNPPSQCTSGTQVYFGTGTSTTDTGVANGVTYYYRACAYDNAGNVSAGASANFIIKYQLTTSVNPALTGAITADCTAGCLYNSGASLGLLAAADIGYVFSSWTGDCSGTNPSTTVFMDAQKACTADFALCGDQPAKNARTTTTYTSLGNTYGDTTPLVGTVDGDTIKLLATTLPETLDLARDISVTLSGGYGCGFTGPASYSIIQGSLTVSKGTVVAEYLIIK